MAELSKQENENLKEYPENYGEIHFETLWEKIMCISKDWFFYKWERIDDIHNVYQKMVEFLSSATEETIE